MRQPQPVTYEEIVNFCGGASCQNEGLFVIRCSNLFAAEELGLLTISTEAIKKLKERFSNA